MYISLNYCDINFIFCLNTLGRTNCINEVRMLLGKLMSLNSQASVHIQTTENELNDLILFAINVKVFPSILY